MLPYPFWFARLPEIIETLAEFRAPSLQRRDLEMLLGVSPRQAANLLKQWTPVRNGVTAQIEAKTLLTIMRQLAEEPDGRAAIASRTRVNDTIAEARSRAAEKRLQIKTTPALRGVTVNSLPPGVTLRPGSPGTLTITFNHFGDFLEKLGFVLKAASNDFDTFEQVCGPDPSSKELFPLF